MPVNPKYTFTDTTTQIRTVVPEFDLVSPAEFPFLKMISAGDEMNPSLNSLSEPCRATKYEWLELTDPGFTTTLTADITSTTSTSIAVATADVANIVADMILLIGSEQVRVTAAANGANPVPITRGFAGTTAATATSSTATITVIGRAHLEGADAPNDIGLYPSMPFNYVQELAATIDVSDLEAAIARYGIDDAIEFETQNRARHLFHMLERGCFYQTKVQGTSTVPGVFGGLDDFIPSANTEDASSGALTTTIFHNAMQKVYNSVGPSKLPNVVVCNAWVRRKLTSIFTTVGGGVPTQFRDAGEMRGGVRVDNIETDFGPLGVALVQNCKPASAYLLRIEDIGIGPMEGNEFRREMMAKTGSKQKFMLYGAYTLQVRASKRHGRITNISLAS